MLALLAAIYGLIVGSFINALVWRIHENRGIARGERSECPNCHHQLSALDLIPVISWIMLRGKCRYCKKGISLQYPLVELATAGLFALSAALINPVGVSGWFSFIIWLFVVSVFVALTIYDLRWMELPHRIVWPTVLVLVVSLMIQAAVFELSWGTVARHFLAAAIIGSSFYILASVAKGKLLGGGDIGLGVIIGLLLGLRGGLVALELAFVLGGLVGIVIIGQSVIKHRKYIPFSTQMPFGPFLVAGTVISYFFAPEIISAYLRLNGLQ